MVVVEQKLQVVQDGSGGGGAGKNGVGAGDNGTTNTGSGGGGSYAVACPSGAFASTGGSGRVVIQMNLLVI